VRLSSFRYQGRESVGVIEDSCIIDLEPIYGYPVTMLSIIDMGLDHLLLVTGQAEKEQSPGIPLDQIEMLAPVPRPRKNVFCVGRNYAEHVKETGANTIPEFPVFFTKAVNTVIGPNMAIVKHPVTAQLDYEAELAVVIGRSGCDIDEETALSHVFGYTIVNDVTARDLQKRHNQWFKGKSLDRSCPMGPVIVTADEIRDPQSLQVKTWVNGELRQAASTSEMLYSVASLISWLSQGYTLESGDVIATGTPAGVGAGYTPGRFLEDGDLVEIEISHIGRLSNRVEAAATATH
jgi:2-keto-4-pentenoate hydratase/2-oxohepta-3-ene-1,7-dioic acid hydratase in catechol pathway